VSAGDHDSHDPSQEYNREDEIERMEWEREMDDMALPFCACGRRWSDCDGSRKGCRERVSQ
jgi:hypothetical protein